MARNPVRCVAHAKQIDENRNRKAEDRNKTNK